MTCPDCGEPLSREPDGTLYQLCRDCLTALKARHRLAAPRDYATPNDTCHCGAIALATGLCVGCQREQDDWDHENYGGSYERQCNR